MTKKLPIVQDKSLGDPLYYTKVILRNPPQKPKYLTAFKKMGGDINNSEQLKNFFLSKEYLILVCEDDYNLFAERVLGYTVKPFHVEWTNDFLENKFSIILAPREHGKSCVISNTYTMIPGKGLVFYEDQAKDMAENTSIKLNLETSVLGNNLPISGFHLNSKMPTLKIRTYAGYEINCTPDHKLGLHTPAGLSWAQVKDLKVGDPLTLTRNTQCFGTNICSSNEAFVAGLFVGDGCNTDKNIYILGESNLNVVEKCLEIQHYTKKFKYFSKKHIPYYQIYLKSAYFKPFAEKFDLIAEKTGPHKDVPKFVREGTKDVVCNFLNGLFCADSHVNLRSHQIEFTTASEKMAKQVQLLLFNLGITASLIIRDDVKAYGMLGTKYYRILINEHFSKKRFAEQIGFRFKDKQEALLKDLECDSQITHSRVPYANKWVRGLREDLKETGLYEDSLFFDRITKNFKDGKSFEGLRKISGRVRECYQPLDSKNLKLIDLYGNPDILIDEIVSIEESEGITGDFEVDHSSHAMNANGFVSHNSIWLIGYIIWNAYYQKKTNILVISETLGQSKMILGGEFSIKEQIMTNEKLIHLYPTLNSRKWSETQIKLTNGVRIEVAGYGQRMRGRHPTLIILDDVLSDQNSSNPQLRAKVLAYFARVIRPMMKKDSDVILIGTAFHPDDLLHVLGKSDTFSFSKYQAVNESTKETLWPEKHSYESLQQYRRDYGELSYQCEYQNNPISDSLSFFPKELLDSCKDTELTYLPAYRGPNMVHLGGDLSPPGGAKDGEGDYTVFLVAEVKAEGNKDILTVLNYIMFRDNPLNKDKKFSEKQIDTLKYLCDNYQVDSGYVEEVGFQAIYTKELIPNQPNLPIKGLTVSKGGKRSEESGIPYIRTLMEKGCIRFPYKSQIDRDMTDEICRQFAGVTLDEGKIGNRVYFDDIVTALWMAVESSKSMSKPMYTLPYDRFAAKSNHLHLPKFRIHRRPFKSRRSS